MATSNNATKQSKAKRTDHSTLPMTQFLISLIKSELHTQMQTSMKPLYLIISGIRNRSTNRAVAL